MTICLSRRISLKSGIFLHFLLNALDDLAHIAQTAAPSAYRVELTFYDPATFEHLPALNPQTGEAFGDTLVVGELAVGE